MRIMVGSRADASVLSTTAGDGNLVVWDLNNLANKIKDLKL